MNTPVVEGGDSAGTDDTAKFIRGLGVAELIFGLLFSVIALIYGEMMLKHFFPADESFWDGLTSPRVLSALHVAWLVYLSAFFLIWHGILCRRLSRPSRPIGFAIGTLFTLKCAVGAITLGFLKLEMDSTVLTVNGTTVNLGERFGLYVGFMVAAAIVLALLAACFALFFAGQASKKALESSDQARYALDSLPLPVFLGVVLFICLGYSYLTDLIRPNLVLAGAHIPTPIQQATLLLFAAGSLLTAWAFYVRRPWGWYAGWLMCAAWALSSYHLVGEVSAFSGPEFDRYRDLLVQLTPVMQRFVLFGDVMTGATLVLFVGYLVYVRRHFVDDQPGPHLLKPSRPEVPIYADWRRFKIGRSALICGGLGALQWVQQEYFVAAILIGSGILTALLTLIGTFMPRCVFRDEGLALTGISLLATPVFPYTSFRSVQFITTSKPPRPMRSIEDGVLNLNVSLFADEQRAKLEEEFRKRGIAITVLAPAEAPG